MLSSTYLPVVFIEHVLSPVAMVNVPIYYGHPILKEREKGEKEENK